MKLNPRIKCVDGVSLSVQANQYAYCSPLIDTEASWETYSLVEVGFIEDIDNNPFTPPDKWRAYAEGPFPSNVYAYIPVEVVKEFIISHNNASHSHHS